MQFHLQAWPLHLGVGHWQEASCPSSVWSRGGSRSHLHVDLALELHKAASVLHAKLPIAYFQQGLEGRTHPYTE